MTEDAAGRRTVKILIAEDEAIFADDLAMTLQELGYRIAGIAPTGEEAVRLAGETAPSLVIMDIKLAGDMDGIQASEQIRTNFDIPVIFLTAYEEPDLLCRAKRTEPYGYLVKPVADRTLASTIETALYRHAADMKGKASGKKLRRAVQKLKVYQEELRTRNEALQFSQSELQRARDLFADLYDSAPVGYITSDEEGLILEANLTAGRILKVEKQELIKTFFARFLCREDADAYRAHLRQVTGAQSKRACELKLAGKDGTPFYVQLETAPVTDEDGRRSRCRTVMIDITDRKLAEETLKTQTDTLELIFETAPCIMMVVNEEGRVERINRAGTTFAGKSSEELLGLFCGEVFGCVNSFYELACGRNAACSSCPIRTSVLHTFETGEQVFQKEGRFDVRKDPDEMTLYLLVSTALLAISDSGKVLVTITDITDRKIGEEERDLLQRQLLHAQKMESIATLAGGIAHDFNNLLQVVVGYSDMLLFRKKPKDGDYEGIQAIRQAGRDGKELVRRILAFSQRLEPNRRPLDLNYEVARIEKLLKRTISKMIRIGIIPGNDLRTVSADPSQMEQVLLNLAVNAQHAMPDGGLLTVETANVTLDEAYCRMVPALEPGKYVMLTVSDTGHGMEKEVLERIFEPFFSTKMQGEGTGLGLAMVYGIIRNHQGHITCESEPGNGTVFKIYLPAVLQDTEWDVSETAEMPAFGTETLLLVEDEEVIRKMAEQLLTMAGYTVLSTTDGREAIELYRADKDRIALVILDWIMPEMGGKQCLEELLKIDGRIKVIVASGVLTEGPYRSAAESRVKGFITKPYNVKELLTLVRKILDES